MSMPIRMDWGRGLIILHPNETWTGYHLDDSWVWERWVLMLLSLLSCSDSPERQGSSQCAKFLINCPVYASRCQVLRCSYSLIAGLLLLDSSMLHCGTSSSIKFEFSLSVQPSRQKIAFKNWVAKISMNRIHIWPNEWEFHQTNPFENICWTNAWITETI